MIRPADISDANRMAEIHVFGWRTAYRGIVSDDFLFTQLHVAKQEKHFQDAIQNKLEESYVWDDGIIKGFLTMGPCRDADEPNAFELWGIYVEPLMKRQGIGSQLVRFCEEIAKARGYTEIVLWVLEKNQSGRDFYEKLGYVADGKRNYIEALLVGEIRYRKDI